MNPKPFHLRFLILAALVLSLFCGRPFSAFGSENDSREVVLTPSGGLLLSLPVHVDRPFNSVILALKDFTPGLEVNFHPLDGNVWQPVPIHDDGFGPTFLLFTSPTQTLQFRKPRVAGESSFSLSVRFWLESSMLAQNPLLLAGPETPAPFRIIPRSEWGADESWRYWTPDTDADSSNTDTETDTGNADPCGDYATRFKDEVAIDRTVSTSSSGDLLTWPLAYSKQIKKIVVHHTDSDIRDLNGDLRTDGQDYVAMLRAIYRFHTITRGWGDIGYNYVIDPLGNVYEGRFGGDRVVGAHALCFNNGSLGISIIGDYQTQKVPEPAVNSLISLIALKAKQFGIDPQGHSSFRGKDLPNIVGHRDVRATSCPGEQLYTSLERIRERSGFVLKSGTWGEGSAPAKPLDYNADALTTVPTLSLRPNQQKELVLQFKNTGTKAWDSNTWLHVALNERSTGRVIPLIPDKTFVAADLTESTVPPGGTGTFKLQLQAGFLAATDSFEVAPVVDGRYKISRSAVLIPFQVETPRFTYSVVKTSLPGGTVFQGQKIAGSIALENTGNVTWVNYGPHAIRLGTDSLRDHRSPLAPKTPTRLAYLAQTEVPPGEVGTFVFSLEAPAKLQGSLHESFTPVIERVAWLEDKGLGFDLNVKKPIHRAQVSEKTDLSNLMPGEMRKVEITLENQGDLPWEPDTMQISLLAKGLKVFKRTVLPDAPVDPHTSAIFDFWVQAPYQAAQATLSLTPKFQKNLILGGGLRFAVDVPSAQLKAEKVDQTSASISLRPGQEKQIQVRFKNTGNAFWRNRGENQVLLATASPQGRSSPLYYPSGWESKTRAGHLLESEVAPGGTGTFVFKVKPQTRGDFSESFQLVMEKVDWIPGSSVQWNFHVSGDKLNGLAELPEDPANPSLSSLVAAVPSKPLPPSPDPAPASTPQAFRLRLSYAADQSSLTADRNFKVFDNEGRALFDLKTGDRVEVSRKGTSFQIRAGGRTQNSPSLRLVPEAGGVVEVLTFERRPAWDRELNDNRFRGVLEIRELSQATAYINELPLEDYLKGLAEVSNTTPAEKQKTMAILARTYALYYMQDAHRKFSGLPYDGSDDPASFQRYLGYGFEIRSPRFVEAVVATQGQVVTYQDELIKTPYFSQSDGKTLSALQVWGWKDTPYLQSVSDPYCKGLARRGHGVGLSGCGAEGMAKAGKKYDAIIKYYYKGVEIQNLSDLTTDP